MINFKSFQGVIKFIDDFYVGIPEKEGCYKLVTLESNNGNIVRFVIEPDTYFIDHFMMTIGEKIIAYYDANAPVPLIYPPQYRALVVSKFHPFENIKVDYFNEKLMSSDGELQLNISPNTLILQENNQIFTGNIANHYLVVKYTATTKSIPAKTSPSRIIVLCRR